MVGAGFLLVSAISFGLYAFDALTVYRGVPMDLIGWATGVLGGIVMVFAGIRRVRKRGAS